MFSLSRRAPRKPCVLSIHTQPVCKPATGFLATADRTLIQTLNMFKVDESRWECLRVCGQTESLRSHRLSHHRGSRLQPRTRSLLRIHELKIRLPGHVLQITICTNIQTIGHVAWVENFWDWTTFPCPSLLCSRQLIVSVRQTNMIPWDKRLSPKYSASVRRLPSKSTLQTTGEGFHTEPRNKIRYHQ